jgi:RNA-directed DNA polymerase
MPEPRGKLDTSVNGPAGSGSAFDGDAWEQVDWREHEQRVRRLRCRIFKAVKSGDLATVRNLQKVGAAVLVEHADQRAAGHATQHGPPDCGG